MRKARVLAAVPPPALPFLEEALGPAVEIVACHALDEAKRRVRDDRLDVVLCGVYFDRSALLAAR